MSPLLLADAICNATLARKLEVHTADPAAYTYQRLQ